MSDPEHALATALLGGVAAFQAALAAGAPWGEAAWGGTHPGVLPPRLRVASGVAAGVWGAAAVAVGAGRPAAPGARTALLRGIAVTSGAGAVLNHLSRSRTEQAVWVPVSATLAGLTWRLSRRPR